MRRKVIKFRVFHDEDGQEAEGRTFGKLVFFDK